MAVHNLTEGREMNPELRELLGRVAFEQSFEEGHDLSLTWENASEQTREVYRRIAETVAMELVTVILPTLHHLALYITGKAT